MLEIQLFGVPQIRLDDQPVKINRRKSRALLYYLADHDQPVSRERLLAFCWPDTPRVSAQSTLRTSLYGLRKLLGSSLIIETDRISLQEGSRADTRSFDEVLSNPTAD